MPQEFPLRITVIQPPAGVTFCLQRGKAELVAPTQTTADRVSFDFTVRLGPPQNNGALNFRGPFTQGPPQDRFVYVNAGRSAGQVNSPWTRRAKIKLAGITPALIESLLTTPGAVIEARIMGKAKDGGPAAATVPLLAGGWQIVPHNS